MKRKLISLLLCLAVFFTVSAKQTLVLHSGEEIEVNIVSIGALEIQYKKVSNPNGPTFSTARSKVFFIIHDDGTKEIITPLDQAVTASSQATSSVSGVKTSTNIKRSLTSSISDAVLSTATTNFQEKKYFPKVSFYPRATIGYHNTSFDFSGYKDYGEIEIKWGGLYWAADLNILIPSSNSSACSLGLGMTGLTGNMIFNYKSNKYDIGAISATYLTFPVQYWHKFNDWFMLGVGTRLELRVSQKEDGKKIEQEAFYVFRDAFMLDSILSLGKFDLGAEMLMNPLNFIISENVAWSPTFAISINAGYRF